MNPIKSAKKKSKLREYVEIVGTALALALVVRALVIQSYHIPSGSMKDTLLIGDFLFANKFMYGAKVPFVDWRLPKIRDPKPGDIVIFKFPGDGKTDYIKRCIAVAGDTVEIRNKQLLINGRPYVTPESVYKDGTLLPGTRDNLPPVKVPAGQYFMMGDNRDRSYDSRFWGFVSTAEIKGLAFIKYWSWDSDLFRPRWDRIGRWID